MTLIHDCGNKFNFPHRKDPDIDCKLGIISNYCHKKTDKSFQVRNDVDTDYKDFSYIKANKITPHNYCLANFYPRLHEDDKELDLGGGELGHILLHPTLICQCRQHVPIAT